MCQQGLRKGLAPPMGLLAWIKWIPALILGIVIHVVHASVHRVLYKRKIFLSLAIRCKKYDPLYLYAQGIHPIFCTTFQKEIQMLCRVFPEQSRFIELVEPSLQPGLFCDREIPPRITFRPHQGHKMNTCQILYEFLGFPVHVFRHVKLGKDGGTQHSRAQVTKWSHNCLNNPQVQVTSQHLPTPCLHHFRFPPPAARPPSSRRLAATRIISKPSISATGAKVAVVSWL